MKYTKIEQDDYAVMQEEVSVFIKYGKRRFSVAEIITSYETHLDIDSGMIEVDTVNIECVYFNESWGCNLEPEIRKYFFENIEEIKLIVKNFLNKIY